MQYEDYIDPRIGFPLAIGLWLLVIWIYLRRFIWPKIDAFFEARRQKRWERSVDQSLKTAVALGYMSPTEAKAYRMVHPQRTNAN
jgi:hypothetical protein